jgi:hypothetical protein
MEDRIPAPYVARLIGIKTPMLAKWRCLGKGPRRRPKPHLRPTLHEVALEAVQLSSCWIGTSHGIGATS